MKLVPSVLLVLGTVALVGGIHAHSRSDADPRAAEVVSPLLIAGAILISAGGLAWTQVRHCQWCGTCGPPCGCDHCGSCSRGPCCGGCECAALEDAERRSPR